MADFLNKDPDVGQAPVVDLSRVWTGVAAEVWRRHPGPVERFAGRVLRSPGLARALLTAPSLTAQWLIATVVILLAGGLFALGGGEPLVWLLAPGVAALGIAYAYGSGMDPAWELACSMPISDRMVLLVRAVCVFAVNAALGTAASGLSYLITLHGAHGSGGQAVTAQMVAVTFAWLIPMTATCALTLAVAVLSRSANAGAVVGVATWGAVVLGGWVTAGAFSAVVTDAAAYLPCLAVAVCATAVIGYAPRLQRGRPQ